MKKIFSLVLLALFGFSLFGSVFSNSYALPCIPQQCTDGYSFDQTLCDCVLIVVNKTQNASDPEETTAGANPNPSSEIELDGTSSTINAAGSSTTCSTSNDCSDGQNCVINPNTKEGTCINIATTPTDNTQTEDSTVNGITIGPNCLLNGQCKFNIYDTLGIRKSVRDPTSVGIFVQDIVLSATTFIGTIVTLAIIISGLMWIMSASTGKDPSKAKSALINSIIGLIIVISSYSIIRLIQYIAKGV